MCCLVKFCEFILGDFFSNVVVAVVASAVGILVIVHTSLNIDDGLSLECFI